MNDYSSKETTKSFFIRKRNSNWEASFATHIIHTGLVSNLHKELLQINKEKI